MAFLARVALLSLRWPSLVFEKNEPLVASRWGTQMAAQSLFLLVTPLGITFTYLVQDSTKPTGILALLPDRVRVGLIRQRR